ncbi:hypothetical protein [Polyangium sorediatum]|uniref:YcaO domain-containing protein n=1 Tax=Polyangium sorediatum TaxID=889274 RepID=A0ABT6NR27_9BACT|nr:hypothetical protein [Polyangium sorediatum]MDI1430738.1 hypothetical protein [Polyangium sorediatum]
MSDDHLENDDPHIRAMREMFRAIGGPVLCNSEDAPHFYAWCAPEDRADAFVAALAVLDERDPPYCVELGAFRKEATRHDLPLEDVRLLARAHLSKETAFIRGFAGVTLRSGEWLDEWFESRGEAAKVSWSEDPIELSVYDASYFFPIKEDLVLGAGPHAAMVEAAAIAIHTQGDVEHILLGLCGPNAGLVTTGACALSSPWGAHLECNATYHADAAAVARDLALSWIHLHDGDKMALLVGLSLDELTARVFAAPEDAHVGIATSLEGVQQHGAEDHEARGEDFPRQPPFSPFARKGVRPIRPGDEQLSREQVLRALATPPNALLDALEASAAALCDDEWRAAEPLARQAIEMRLSGGPTYELLHTVEHRRLIEQHAPYRVHRLPTGGVLLATHPFRTLWPLWADALALLGIRPRGGG